MVTFNSLKTKIQGLIDKSNTKTGENNTDLTSAVDKLVEGYGTGIKGLKVAEHWRIKDVQDFIGENGYYESFEGEDYCYVRMVGVFIVNGAYCSQINFEAYRHGVGSEKIARYINCRRTVDDEQFGNSVNSIFPIYRENYENEGKEFYTELADIYILSSATPYIYDSSLSGFDSMTLEEWLSRVATKIEVTQPETKEDSPLPIEVYNEEAMTALLDTAEVGGVYKYTGATGTYENGAIYIVEEVSE